MSNIKTNKKRFIIKSLITFSFILMNQIALGMEENNISYDNNMNSFDTLHQQDNKKTSILSNPQDKIKNSILSNPQDKIDYNQNFLNLMNELDEIQKELNYLDYFINYPFKIEKNLLFNKYDNLLNFSCDNIINFINILEKNINQIKQDIKKLKTYLYLVLLLTTTSLLEDIEYVLLDQYIGVEDIRNIKKIINYVIYNEYRGFNINFQKIKNNDDDFIQKLKKEVFEKLLESKNKELNTLKIEITNLSKIYENNLQKSQNLNTIMKCIKCLNKNKMNEMKKSIIEKQFIVYKIEENLRIYKIIYDYSFEKVIEFYKNLDIINFNEDSIKRIMNQGKQKYYLDKPHNPYIQPFSQKIEKDVEEINNLISYQLKDNIEEKNIPQKKKNFSSKCLGYFSKQNK